MALMLTRYETHGLFMAYAGLRVAEACAVTRKSLRGDTLVIDRQVLELHKSGNRTESGQMEHVLRLGPTKCRENDVVIPHWLVPRVEALTESVRPSSVRASIKRARRKLGIELNPHQLRHWYASESLCRGVSIKTVSRQLRHGDIATTMRTYAQRSSRENHDAWG
jgi:integrase